MKPSTMLAASALAALVAMACVGTSGAMAEATALCDIDPGTGLFEVCPENHLITETHEANLSGSKEKMLFGITTVECDVLFTGQASEPLAEPLLIGGSYEYSNCNNGCTVTETNLPIIEILKTGHEKAAVTIYFEVAANCTGMNCVYLGVVKGTGWGPLLSLEANGEISIQKQEIFRREGSCPPSALLDLRTTPLVKTYITR